jgi:serine protease Do
MDSDSKSVGSRCNYFGMKMITITQQVHDFINSQPGFNIKLPGHISEGCLVIEVAPDSPAQKAGIMTSDVVIKINDKKVKKYRDILEIVNSSINLKLTILRNGSEITIQLYGE